MATFTVSASTGQTMANLWPSPGNAIVAAFVTSSTQYLVQLANGTFLRYNGSLFAYNFIANPDLPIGGTYTSVDIVSNSGGGTVLATLSGVNASLADIVNNPIATVLSGDDNITGGVGNDTLTGQFGFDTMNGGGGIDTADYSFFTGSTQWNMTTGAVGFNGVGSTETAINFENAIMGSGADSVTGTTAANNIRGGGGNDTINAGSGDDIITGGIGGDSINGEAGDDVIIVDSDGAVGEFADGGADTDRLRFTGSFDVSGGSGGDFSVFNIEQIEIGSGFTAIINSSEFTAGGIATNVALISGGSGVETLQINPNATFSAASFNLGSWGANDIVFINGQLGAYSSGALTGTSGRDSIVGYINADTLDGGAGDDTLVGSGGNDTIEGGLGDDSMDGGAGTGDIISFASYAPPSGTTGVVVNLGLQGTAQNTNAGTDTFTNFEGATGSAFDDRIFGSAGNDTLRGGAGADGLFGNSGADQLFGDAGNDTLVSVFGDAVVSGEVYDGGADTDNLQISGDTSATIFDFRDDTLVNLENLFFGIQFGGGATVQFNASQFTQFGTVLAAAHAGQTIRIEVSMDALTTLSLAGVTVTGLTEPEDKVILRGDNDAETITGSSINDQFFSNGGADLVDGAAGSDYFEGGEGADTLIGGSGNDVFAYRAATEINGDSIDGGADAGGIKDVIQVIFTGDADFRTATFGSTGGNTSIEYFALFGDNHNIIFNASQFGPSGISTAMSIEGDSGTDIVTINNISGAFSAAGFSTSFWNDALSRIVLNGGGNGDTITGSFKADSINGNSGSDSLDGGDGADTIEGGLGDDTLNGGAGTGDILSFASYAPPSGTTGVNVNLSLQGTAQNTNAGTDTYTGFEGATGSAFNDFIVGGTGSDTLRGGAGADGLVGSGGIDQLFGDAGNDILGSGFADAVVSGEIYDGGADYDILQITGDTSATIFNFRDDTLLNLEQLTFANQFGGGATAQFNASQFTQLGAVFALPHAGQTIVIEITMGALTTLSLAGVTVTGLTEPGDKFSLFGDSDGETITGSSINDQFFSSGGADRLDGGAGKDSLNGGEGADTLIGGSGDDLFGYFSQLDINGDSIDGGASSGVGGQDYLEINFTGDADFRTATFGSTGGNTSIESIELFGANHNIIFNAGQFGPSGISTALTISGDSGTDIVTINSISGAFSAAGFSIIFWNDALSRLVLNGGGNGDAITGSSKADSLSGSTGNDFLTGGAGNDSLNGGADFDYANYLDTSTTAGITLSLALTTGQNTGGAGTDTLTSIEGIYGSNFGDTLTGDNAAVNALYGWGGADSLSGNGGFDYIEAGEADDTLDGGAGDDFLLGGNGIDTLTFASAGAAVYVDMSGASAFANGTASGFDVLSGIERVIGSGFGDFLFGSAGSDTLTGGVGIDILYGFGLGDSLDGGADTDYIVGGAGADTITTGGGQDYIYFQGQNEGKDTITDWRANGFDLICIDEPQFGGGLAVNFYLDQGANIGRFVAGTLATAAIGQFLWNSATSTLSWDADGTGGGAAVQLVTLTGITSLLASDILVL